MLPSLNLFKSVTCPFYSKPNSNQTCERPYCQFKHPVSGASATIAKKRKADGEVEDVLAAPSTAHVAATTDDPTELIKNLPTTIENLTQALQSIQQLFKTTAQLEKPQTPVATSSINNTIAITLANQLTSLTSEILSSVSNNTSTSVVSQHSVSGEDSAQRAKVLPSSPNAMSKQPTPVYNPTPIYELNKLKMVKSESTAGEPTSPSLDAKRPKLSEDGKSPSRIQLVEHLNEAKPVKSAGEAVSKATKTSVVAFSKMPLSQQVLKRYEMMNMAPPTSAAINEAKLAKQQQAAGAASQLAKGDTKNVPHLILDKNASSFKIPLVVRQRYLKMIFDNGKEVYGSVEKACKCSAEEEKAIYDRAKSKAIYMNLVANLVKSLRSKSSSNTSASSPTKPSSYSHEAILSGPKASRVSYSINRTKQIEAKDLSETDLYKMFFKYVLTEQQLEDNGFPNWVVASTGSQRLAYIPNYHQNKVTNNYLSAKKDKQSKEVNGSENGKASTASTLIRECKRCKSTFKLLLKDMSYYPDNSQCVYHWGKMRNQRFNKAIESKYLCCSGGTGSEGCEIGKHVYDGEYDGYGTGTNIIGYVETRDKSDANDPLKHQTSQNIYSVDCEMCYTTSGLELARVSVVDVNGTETYESLVKPATEVVDYNTRWSGLNANLLKNCTKTLKDVQDDLLKLFNKDTILIGHSLDSDFKALKLIHRRVIDTTVVFPHKLGPPIKRALRTLMSEYLQKIIQEDG